MKSRPGSIGAYLRICDAVATSACDAAEEIPAAGDEPRKLRCKQFDCEIVESVYVDADTEDLTPTGETVRLPNKFPSAVTVGRDITIALKPDQQWTIIVMFCDE